MKQIKPIIVVFFLFCIIGSFATAESYSNQTINWGIKKSTGGVPAEAGKAWDDLLAKHGAFYKANPSKKEIYLTFDNGYENGYTAQILDVLKKEKVPATFFVTGHYLETAPDLVKRMATEGHIVGNHSWSHPDLTKSSDEQIVKELEKVRKKAEEITGNKTMKYLRPPRGVFSDRTLAIAKQQGYTHAFWSLAYVDWNTDKQKGAQYAYDNIMKQMHPGAVILLHTVSKDNADALERVIQDVKKEGYTFKSLDEMKTGQEEIKDEE